MRSATAVAVMMLGGVMLGSAVAADGAKPEDGKLEAAFKSYLDAWFQAEPLTATRLGEHKYDDKLDDLAPEARAKRDKLDRDTLASLAKNIDPAKLSRDGRIDFEIFRRQLESSLWLREHFQPIENDPRVYGTI